MGLKEKEIIVLSISHAIWQFLYEYIGGENINLLIW
jgi:hypothetical protein